MQTPSRSQGADCSSGDLTADRRYLYAKAAAREQDYASAAELLEQTLELVPTWAPLWFDLAAAYEKLGLLDKAVSAFARADGFDRGRQLGADLHLARLGAARPPAAASEAYVRGLFEQYAERFDSHLEGLLSYCGPMLLAEAIARLGAAHFTATIDLGCGTGLCGAAFRARSDNLSGIDLSPRMAALARQRQIYDRLEIGPIGEFLAGEPAGSASLLLAADVLVYFGDLAPIFAQAARALASGGLFAFTLQHALQQTEDGYALGAELRFSHHESYVRWAAAAAGLRIALMEEASMRKELGAPTPGLLVIAAKD